MVAFFESLSDDLRDWALEQQLFFIASAPLTGKHVNVSPKGLPSATFTFFDANHAAYIDMTGSGAETISHLYENGRATIMFCSFGKSPRIMRLFCTGRVIEYADSGYADALSRMGKKDFAGARAVILLDIWKVCFANQYPLLILVRYSLSRYKHHAVSQFHRCQKPRPRLSQNQICWIAIR